ncbi:uncharacterized protein V6R79_008882 [Siganus canaliculatus]
MEDNLSSLINNWKGGQNSTVEELRADLLALTSVYLGLGGATFILVFCVLHKKLALLCCSGRHVQLKSFQNVHTFFFALLIMDVVHVAVTAIYMTDLVNDCDVLGANFCLSNHSVWMLSRYFMVVLLLFAALMSIRYLCDPPSEGKLCCMGPLVFVLFVEATTRSSAVEIDSIPAANGPYFINSCLLLCLDVPVFVLNLRVK